jgi:hypothetical protein
METNKNDIISKLNNNFNILNNIQNQLNTRNNLIQESLLKKELLLKIENEDLLEQLKELDNIENIISNRNRLIEMNNKYLKEQEYYISSLKIGLFISVIFIIILILYGLKFFNYYILKFSFIIFIILIIFLVLYATNWLYFRNSLDYFNITKKETLLAKLENLDKSIKKKSKDIILGESNKEWIKNNCNCPEKEDGISDINSDYIPPEIPGYFYNDGTAPSQLLIPFPENTDTLKLNAKIEWPDYSPNGNINIDNKGYITNKNNRFYNYNKQNDPSILLLKNLDKSNVLDNETTKTADL